jgi:secreted protein with Ig-like and vWFA domain
MNDTRLLPDDPRLTAYALGELTGDERAAVEIALRENPALRVAVDEIRATASLLQSALADEPIFAARAVGAATAGIVIDLNGHAVDAPAVNGSTRKRVKVNGKAAASDVEGEYRVGKRAKLLRFPQFYYVVATAAAACFAVFVARYEPPMAPKPRERIVTREIALTPVDGLRSGETDPRDASPAPAAESPVASLTVPTSLIEPGIAPRLAAVNPPLESGSPAGSSFVEGDLSLTNQIKRDPVAAPRDGASPALSFGLSPLLTRDRWTLNNAGAWGASYRARNPNFFEAPPPPISGPVVASTTAPSVVPNVAVVATAGGTPTNSSAGEVVVLNAFMVTADRAVGFAGVSGARSQASDQRAIARRDDRPFAPPGARLVRHIEASSFVKDNDFVSTVQSPLSTFAVDVNTASYANVRRILQHGTPPPREAVRIEEMVNYFPYRYAPPRDDQPFAAALEVAEAPWAANHRLVRIGLKAREVPAAQRPPANLVFLLDVSASMNEPNKLPLVQQALRLLVGKLKPEDRVAIVTYGGHSGLVLASTPAARAREILNALDALTPNGSANGAPGIHLAYEVARANLFRDGINRVILCTDGDFDLGTPSESELVRLIEEKATTGVALSVLGFGMGHYKDATLEKLAGKGHGSYGYIDTKREAEKMLVEQVSSTLVTIAKDVKIQVEFNPATVSSYRLIGYENRLLRKEDFNDDNADAGEVGAGHTITALYEIVPVGAVNRPGDRPADELKYAVREPVSPRRDVATGKRDAFNNELLTVKVRYKKPTGLFNFAQTIEFPLVNATTAFAKASADFRFAAAVAEFGMILRGSPHRGTGTMADVAAWAATAATTPADDPGGYRGEFIELVRKAQTMME